MELTGEQLKTAETLLKRYLPRSQPVYGTLVLRNRVRSDPVKVLVDRWPEFNVILCKPQYEQEGDLFKDVLVFANDEVMLKETIRKSSVIDWTLFLCVGIDLRHAEIFTAVASEKNAPSKKRAVCHMMILEDVSKLPSLDSINPGICLSCLDESHIGLVNQTWKFGKNEAAMRMMHNMTANFPSCCVLDAERKPVSWILTYSSCAMGMLYTLPEHRGKGYAKVLVGTMARRLLAEGYPVYCFIEEENTVSYRLFKNLGFTENPSYRETWFAFNYI
ncbi:glycine N-acyltransferase-like protein 3 [Seriola lalandi dorsalis]|uniref:glycine N-acyltransferase-like protein 3 n=1 Tax=Seriola lalandi dorsalis TaxID=1841481 RepID=UPI000C6F938E|nr:glycine N-acyltransferase-like protein 3 [Seriola lalandi dorsalis]